jgi:hypothetical protein
VAIISRMAKKIEKSNENLRNCEFNAEELLMEPHNARVILKVLLRFIYKALSLKLTKKNGIYVICVYKGRMLILHNHRWHSQFCLH